MTGVDLDASDARSGVSESTDRLGVRWRRDRTVVFGWVLVVAGAAAIIAGYVGLRTQPDVLGQMPYVMSGGFGGLALVTAGGIRIGSAAVEKANERLNRLEEALVVLEDEMLGEFDALRAERGADLERPAIGHRATTDV